MYIFLYFINLLYFTIEALYRGLSQVMTELRTSIHPVPSCKPRQVDLSLSRFPFVIQFVRLLILRHFATMAVPSRPGSPYCELILAYKSIHFFNISSPLQQGGNENENPSTIKTCCVIPGVLDGRKLARTEGCLVLTGGQGRNRLAQSMTQEMGRYAGTVT